MSEETPILYCHWHPTVETSLRCNRCEKPMCTRCARPTPTGYRCKECMSGQQKIFDTAKWWDYPLVFFITAVLSYLGSLAASFLGFWTIFLAPAVGVGIAEVARRVVNRRRSKRLFQVAAAGAVTGALPLLLTAIFALAFGGRGGGLFSLLVIGFYTFTVASTILYRMGGISIR